MAISTVSSLNSLFAALFEDALFVAREANMMTNLVTNYNATGWMNRSVSIYPTVSAVAVAEGTDFASPTTFTKTSLATLTPNEVIAQVILTDRRIDTDPDDARRDAAQELGNAVATKIDVDLVGEFTNFTTDKGPGAGSAATIATFAAGISVLRNALAPNPIYVVAHPYHWHDIWTELGQPAANQAFLGDVANEALRSFYVGSWTNASWFVNANISVDTDSDAISAMFNPGGLAFDSRKAPTLEPERDASLRAWELNLSAGYADGVRRDAFGVKYTADATEPT
jgi:hypothetical protein